MNRHPAIKILYCLFAVIISMNKSAAQNKTPDLLVENLLRKNKPLFDSVLANRNDWRVQILYSEILRDKKGKVSFADHGFNLNEEMYYYPASTVKLPVAILALQKLNELRIKGLDKNTTMITETAGSRQTAVYNDPSSADGRPTVAHYIKKILLVSDNDAFNRLYEFLGQEYINNTLQQMGYRHAQIIHRLEVVLTEEENRRTNPVRFVDSTGKLVYDKPAETSGLLYAARNTRIGKGFYRGGQLVNEPFDFSKKNRLTLVELHNIVKSILFPEAVPNQMRFNLTADDYTFLRKYMSMWPGESATPVYSAPDYWDTYVKFLYYGAENNKPDTALRIFNKVGDAYGFLIDGAYIADYANKTDFLLSAVIYCNSDGILNDNNYDYDTIGLPFMKNLGRMIHAYERTKVRKQPLTFFPQLPLYTR